MQNRRRWITGVAVTCLLVLPGSRIAGATASGPAPEQGAPVTRLVLLGHQDHGQEELAASLGGTPAGAGSQAAEEALRALRLSVRQVEFATPARRYVLSVPAQPLDALKLLVSGAVEADGAILVVSAADGPMPQTRQHVHLAAQVGVTSLVVYLSQADRVDPELLGLVELEIRELLSTHGFPGGVVPFIRGGASPAPAALAELKTALDGSVPLPVPPLDGAFLMQIEDTFTISGRGAVVTGRIERGVVEPGDTVEVVGLRDTTSRTVSGVEMYGDLLDRGEAGDVVGVLLRDTTEDDVERGQVLARPGSIWSHTRFRAEVYMLAKEEGGRHTPFFAGYRPQLSLRTAGVTGVVTLPEGTEMVMPGDHLSLEVELLAPIALETGDHFAIREGSRTVGAGTVTEIVE
jgi:elongation factor Tu